MEKGVKPVSKGPFINFSYQIAFPALALVPGYLSSPAAAYRGAPSLQHRDYQMGSEASILPRGSSV